MLSLQFENSPAEAYALIGPATYFRLTGNRLQVGPGDMDIASYRDGKWQFPSSSFASITVQSPTQIAFEPDGSAGFIVSGPFDNVRFTQGAIWHGDGSSELIAEFDERSQSWSVYPDGIQCSGGLIAPVPGEPAGTTAARS